MRDLLLLILIWQDSRTFGQNVVFPDDVTSLLATQGGAPSNRNRFIFDSFSDSCQVPEGGIGRCLPYRQCPALIQFVSQNGLQNRNTVRYLRRRICRLLRTDVHLCCHELASPARSNQQPQLPSNSLSLIPSKDECGRSSRGRIVNGKEIPVTFQSFQPGSHPWLVGIGLPRPSNGKFRVFCGGTLITRMHVLTAAHCFVSRVGFPPLTHVILGEHSLSKNVEQDPPIVVRFVRKVSPGYDQNSQINDIELLTLEREIGFTSSIRPACLPFGFENRNLDGMEMTIVGWGDTFFRSNKGSDVPLASNITVIPKSVCREAYIQLPEIPLDAKQLCAAKEATDSCQGDSGGPLIYADPNENFRFFLMGIVSFGVECANPNYPGVYTYVPQFMDWITKNLS